MNTDGYCPRDACYLTRYFNTPDNKMKMAFVGYLLDHFSLEHQYNMCASVQTESANICSYYSCVIRALTVQCSGSTTEPALSLSNPIT